jgi:hypothetical protein
VSECRSVFDILDQIIVNHNFCSSHKITSNLCKHNNGDFWVFQEEIAGGEQARFSSRKSTMDVQYYENLLFGNCFYTTFCSVNAILALRPKRTAMCLSPSQDFGNNLDHAEGGCFDLFFEGLE